ncbi:MAG: helix-turn-helix transcriptional regulator [Pseudobutyrivibrio sp.]|nr:helix-turn-helix transcriptional regulator [Pseudobutyrivibrio sp.]
MENSTEIGNRIKEARKALHLSQTELAHLLGKTMRTVQKYESGEIQPSITMIYELAKVLETSPAELIGYQKQSLKLETLSDVLYVLHELDRKSGLKFNIEVNRPPRTSEWTCSLKFNGNEKSADLNADFCLFLERYASEKEDLEEKHSNPEYFERWFDTELAYYAKASLENKNDD